MIYVHNCVGYDMMAGNLLLNNKTNKTNISMSTIPKWNRSVPFPRDNFILRCIEESFGPSKSSGKPMISLEYEVVSPEDAVSADGKRYTVVGEKIIKYYTTKSVDGEGNIDADKSAFC